jgi:ATP-dependent DNA helicase PIF1
MVLIEIGNML